MDLIFTIAADEDLVHDQLDFIQAEFKQFAQGLKIKLEEKADESYTPSIKALWGGGPKQSDMLDLTEDHLIDVAKWCKQMGFTKAVQVAYSHLAYKLTKSPFMARLLREALKAYAKNPETSLMRIVKNY